MPLPSEPGSRPAPATAAAAPRLAVVVLALNEERRIEACLRSCDFAQQIVVIDNGSQDATRELAQRMGAQVHVYSDWRGFAEQRNRSLAHCPQADYVFFLDADEEIPNTLRDEIQAIVQRREVGAWKVLWRQVAFGVELTRMKSTAGMLRLFERRSLRSFEGAVHERALLQDGTPMHTLRAHLLHHSYDSVHTGLKKLTQYAMLGASKRAATHQRGGVVRGLVSASAAFVRLYVLKRGFLHGGAGFLFCYLLAQECFFRYAALHYDRASLSDKVQR